MFGVLRIGSNTMKSTFQRKGNKYENWRQSNCKK